MISFDDDVQHADGVTTFGDKTLVTARAAAQVEAIAETILDLSAQLEEHFDAQASEPLDAWMLELIAIVDGLKEPHPYVRSMADVFRAEFYPDEGEEPK